MKITTIGSATRDCIIQNNNLDIRKSKQGEKETTIPLGSKIELEDIILDSGGGGTNSAVTFARQGFEVNCFTKIGDDASGREIISDLDKEGIDVSGVKKSDFHTAYSVVILTSEGRSIFVYRGAAKDFKIKDIKQEKLAESDWLYITSLGGKIDLLEKIITATSDQATKVALNPGSKEIEKRKRILKLLPQVGVLILNEEEALNLSGQENINTAFKNLNSASIVIITKGKDGAELAFENKKIVSGIFPEKKLIDRTGAGDAFGSGFVSGFIQAGGVLEEDSLKEGLRLAAANSTSVVEHLGAKKKILTKKEFTQNQRWQNLEMEIQSL